MALNMTSLRKKAEELRNWGKWGPDDELGTLNYATSANVVAAAGLIRTGKSFALALPYDSNGPQTGRFNRFNPIHTMLATGLDHCAGKQEHIKIGYSDDSITMPLQCGTQWDALSHIFYDDKMWNGYDAKLVSSGGAEKNGIEKVKNRMVGRGVLLDIARLKGKDTLEDGYAIMPDDLDAAAKKAGIEVRQGDFVLVRTGQMGDRLRRKDWGSYSGGDAPGLAFETLDWIQAKRIAAVATDTWGAEVRPNQTDEAFQPWHWVAIPNIGLSVGEIFYLEELAEDCAKDGVYEFFFAGQPLPFTGAVGSPVNPLAIK